MRPTAARGSRNRAATGPGRRSGSAHPGPSGVPRRSAARAYSQAMNPESVAQALLDAQVTWIVGRLTGDEVPDLVTALVDDALAVAETVTLAALIDPSTVKSIARTLATDVPPSVAASTLVERGAEILISDRAGTYALGELVDRENVARITDEILALTPVIEELLDDLTRSPLTATLASRFVGRIVNDVVAGNRAMAEKIPGIGSLVSFGSKAAGRAIGTAGEQLEAVFGDTAAKGAEFMMGRLNKIIIAMLNDPSARAAVLEVYDLYAGKPAKPLSEIIAPDDATRIAGVGQDVVIAAAVAEPVRRLVDAFIDGFFAIYGDLPAAEILDDLDLTRDIVVEYAVAAAPRAIAAIHGSGELDRIVRDRLAPFYTSPEVLAILAGDS